MAAEFALENEYQEKHRKNQIHEWMDDLLKVKVNIQRYQLI
jgi:hypothetical protein